MSIVYGARSPQFTSPDIDAFFTVHPQFLDILEFNNLPAVELFPFLEWVPERWANWKQNAKRIRKMHDDLFTRLFDRVERRLQQGLETGAFMENLILNASEWGMDKRELLV